MKPYKNNPRTLTNEQAKRLRRDLERFGDLSGIVHDLNSDQICGGHQRLRVLFGEKAGEFDINDAQVEIVKRLDRPDAQGTVAHGFVVWRGFRYSYRQVRWDEVTFKEANIKANLDGGWWDWDVLANTFDAKELVEFGFNADFQRDVGRTLSALSDIVTVFLDDANQTPTTEQQASVSSGATDYYDDGGAYDDGEVDDDAVSVSQGDSGSRALTREERTYHITFDLSFDDAIIVDRALKEVERLGGTREAWLVETATRWLANGSV